VFPLLAVLLSAGCFKYQVVELNTVEPQEEVRVQITNDAAVRLAGHYGSIAQQLDGQLLPFGSDSLLLAIWIGRPYAGTSFENARQRLSLGRHEVTQVSRRKFSPTRTAVVSAGAALVLGIMIHRIAFLENPNPGPGGGRSDPPDPEGILIPVRIRY
jgi:hypothetical protein